MEEPAATEGPKINRFATRTLTAVASLLLAGSLTGCDAAANAFEIIESAPRKAADAPAPADPSFALEATNALAQLENIPVKGRAPKTGYTRDEFGPAWADVDRNGCDTRNDILARDLTNETFKQGTNNCVVTTGTLADKYTGTGVNFVRGQDTSSEVQIDHIVPLSDAWQKGAQQLNADQRKELANDPLNLMAADGPTNSAKGDKDAATWLPPNKAFRCEYVARQTAVKVKYGLWVTQAEHDAIVGILEGCK
ncbi:HNH endonuclease family protein [Arthrobacter sp. D3-16]